MESYYLWLGNINSDSFMLKMPALIYIGAAILGWTAAELMTADKAVGIYLADYALIIKVMAVGLVLSIGYYLNHRKKSA